jgi:4-amino-4-deoxy-L-arabinose transferase-like glycosyltransferase
VWSNGLATNSAAIAIIPLTASLALKLTGSTRTALIAASLAAFNPYLIYWGPAIRAYSLLVALSLLAINEFFHWYRQRDWWSGVRCAAVVLLLLLAHPNGIYTVAFLMLLLAAATVLSGWSGGRKFLWESRTLWILLAGVAVLIGGAYWRLLPDMAKVNREWGTDTPPNKHGISSAGLYDVHGYRLRRVAVRVFPPCRLLVGGTREASASSDVCSNHSGSDSHVLARDLRSYL